MLSLASTGQGGKGAVIRCVPEWLNGFYGYLWNIFRIDQVKNHGFVKDSMFRIILDDCDHTVAKRDLTDKRQAKSPLLSSHGNRTCDEALPMRWARLR